jgi:hypothetical protein
LTKLRIRVTVEKSDPEFIGGSPLTTISQPEAVDFLGSAARVLATGGSLGLVHIDHPAGDVPPLTSTTTRTRASTSSAAS